MQPWDSYDAYLFDLDGTLLNCRDAVHYFAFCEALGRITGKPTNLDGVVVHGNTDVGILRDALLLNGVREDAWRPHLPEILSAMCSFVSNRAAELRVDAVAGARAACEHLRSRGAILGVATGNLQAIGLLKLQHSGLAPYFSFGQFSDMCEYRRDVFRFALEEARRRTSPAARICVIGDTPSDISAAQENGMDVIAVATGIFTAHELRAGKPTFCVDTLSDLLSSSGTVILVSR